MATKAISGAVVAVCVVAGVVGLARGESVVLAHPRRTRAAGERTRARVREHYSWDRIADQCERLYEGALRSRAA